LEVWEFGLFIRAIRGVDFTKFIDQLMITRGVVNFTKIIDRLMITKGVVKIMVIEEAFSLDHSYLKFEIIINLKKVDK
jgi:hypothetical protein